MTESNLKFDTTSKWKVWCTDKFGRSNDTYVSKEGRGILAGLCYFWSKELDTGYHNQGSRSWMYYDLIIEHNALKGRIKTFENKDVIKKLKLWVKSDREAVLNKVSVLHLEKLENSPTSVKDNSSLACELMLEQLESIESLKEFLKL